MLSALLNISETDPNRIAITDFSRDISYRKLNEGADYYAARFQTAGVQVGMHIAVMGNSNAEFIKVILALWKLKAVPVPLNTRLLDNELRALINHSAAGFLIIDAEYEDRLQDLPVPRITYPFENETGNIPVFPADTIIPSSTALVLYTSGTTGRPKGVALTFNNLQQSAEAADTLIKGTKNDKWLASLPFYHIGGFSIIIRSILSGASLIIPRSLKTEDLADTLIKFKPTLVSFVTTVLERMISADIIPPKDLRYVFLGGGPVSKSLIQKSLDSGWKIVKVYGSTETSSMVTALPYTEMEDHADSAGKPLGSNQVVIRSFEDGSIINTGQPGEITIKGGSVFSEYINDEEETGKKLKEGFYYSGDIGHVDKYGYLYVHARRTDLIITGGENVNPVEVEHAIMEFPGAREVCVFPVDNKEWGQAVAAAVVMHKDSEPDTDKLTEFLRGRIAHYKVPKFFFFTDALPKTALGKIMRSRVRETFGKSF